MTNWIQNVVEPNRLILAWQAADLKSDRFRWAVGEIGRSGNDVVFRYFEDGAEFESLNGGRSYSDLTGAGYAGYPAFKVEAASFDQDVMTVFGRRLPSRGRSDYADYLEHFRLKPDTHVSDFALLGLTGATLPSDGFSVVDPFDEVTLGRDLLMEIVGYRHYAQDLAISEGDRVDFTLEPSNAHDQDAVMLRAGEQVVGYVNRLRTRAFRTWISEGRLSGAIERLNGRPDHPRAFVFVHVEPEARRAAA